MRLTHNLDSVGQVFTSGAMETTYVQLTTFAINNTRWNLQNTCKLFHVYEQWTPMNKGTFFARLPTPITLTLLNIDRTTNQDHPMHFWSTKKHQLPYGFWMFFLGKSTLSTMAIHTSLLSLLPAAISTSSVNTTPHVAVAVWTTRGRSQAITRQHVPGPTRIEILQTCQWEQKFWYYWWFIIFELNTRCIWNKIERTENEKNYSDIHINWCRNSN